MPPGELLALARAEVRGYGVDIVEDEVIEITTGFTVRLGGGRSVSARRLLIATGAVDELPDIAGAHERWGQNSCIAPTATAGRFGTSRSG